MAANTLETSAPSLGSFLRDRRARLQPAPGVLGRRRTPGLRREEVAARASVSVTWYTWLEQGRGGPPSDDVLERLATALELDTDGREVLFSSRITGRRRSRPRRPPRSPSRPSASTSPVPVTFPKPSPSPPGCTRPAPTSGDSGPSGR